MTHCTPPTLTWLASQVHTTPDGPGYPRPDATLTWCGGPDTWVEPMWGGDVEPCFYGVTVLIGPNLVPYRLRIGSDPGFTSPYNVCADDWWDVSPGWARCAL